MKKYLIFTIAIISSGLMLSGCSKTNKASQDANTTESSNESSSTQSTHLDVDMSICDDQCGSMDEGSLKDMCLGACFAGKAIKENDTNYCLVISEDVPNTSNSIGGCLGTLAKVNKDVSLCNKTSIAKQQQLCMDTYKAAFGE